MKKRPRPAIPPKGIMWPPPALVPYLKKTLAAPAAAEVLDILVGNPGPWWPDWVAPIMLPETIALVQELREDEPKRQAIGAAWRARDKQFLSVANRVRALPFSKPEKKAAVLALLESECVITRLRKLGKIGPGPMKPSVQKRAARSSGEDHTALRWLRPQAVALVTSLRARGGVDSDRKACAQAARILSLASGARITPEMVKDRVWRARGDK